MAAAIGKLTTSHRTRHHRHKMGDEGNGRCLNQVVSREESSLLLKHNPGFSLYWTANEQSILQTGMAKYAPETNVMRYAKIAMQLPDKTVRDVALRCKWTAAKEGFKRRKEHNAQILKEKKNREELLLEFSHDKVASLTILAALKDMLALQNTFHSMQHGSYASSMNDNSHEEFDASSRQLLEHNAQALHQISTNMVSHQIQENISLFLKCRANIMTILKSFDATTGMMKQMPSIQVTMDEELVGRLITHTTFLSEHL